jgi:hypothetical protein
MLKSSMEEIMAHYQSRSVRFLLTLFLILCLLPLMLGAGGPTHGARAAISAAAATVSVSPSTVAAGGQVTVTGSMFAQNETVTISLGTMQVGTGHADDLGNFGATITIPANTPAGSYQIVAQGASSGDSGQAALQVTAAQAPTTVSVNPTSVAAGGTVTVTGAGFQPNETVRVQLTTNPPIVQPSNPPQFPGPTLTTVTADGSGNFTATNVTIPSDQPAGGFAVGAVGGTSGQTAFTPLTITAAQTPATVSVNPASVAAGGTVTVTGAGFQPGETVRVQLTSNPPLLQPSNPPQFGGPTLTTATANGSGSFTATNVTIPSDQPAGGFAVGAVGGTSGRTAFTPLTITAAQTPATVSVNPTSVAAGGTVTITGAGFQAGETVRVQLTTNPPIVQPSNPPQFSGPTLTTVTADGSGNFTATNVTIPSDQPPGGFAMGAIGGTSGRAAFAPLTITAAQASVSVNPTSVVVGGTVAITGTGFQPGETVKVQLTSNPPVVQPSHPPQFSGPTLGTTTANTSGSFSLTNVTIPSDQPAGSYAVGAVGGTSGRTAFTPLTVTAAPPPSGPTTAYFAEGYTGTAAVNGRANFTTTLNILNPGNSAAAVTITYYIQGSSTPSTVTRSVPASRMLRESVNNDVGSDKIVASVVRSPQRVFVSRTITRVAADGARLDGSSTAPVSAPGRSWGFPEGYTGVTFQQYLTMLNPNNVQAHVRVVLAPQASTSAGARTLSLTVPPFGRSTANIRALNQGSSAQSVGMQISSDQPIVPERVLYFGDGAGSGKFGSTVRSGIGAGSSRLSIAYGSSGGIANGDLHGDQAFITLLNPASSGSVQVTASFFGAGGHLRGQSSAVTVSAGTRQTIIANNVLGSAAVAPFSVLLSATGPIMAESAQYYNGSPNVGQHPGVDFEAVPQGSSDLFLSDLATTLPDGTAVKRVAYLYNPGTASITVTARYFGAGGATTPKQYSIPAGGITTVDVNSDTASIAAGPLGAEFVLANGNAGSFLVYAVGRTSDNLSATEDVGTPAS